MGIRGDGESAHASTRASEEDGGDFVEREFCGREASRGVCDVLGGIPRVDARVPEAESREGRGWDAGEGRVVERLGPAVVRGRVAATFEEAGGGGGDAAVGRGVGETRVVARVGHADVHQGVVVVGVGRERAEAVEHARGVRDEDDVAEGEHLEGRDRGADGTPQTREEVRRAARGELGEIVDHARVADAAGVGGAEIHQRAQIRREVQALPVARRIPRRTKRTIGVVAHVRHDRARRRSPRHRHPGGTTARARLRSGGNEASRTDDTETMVSYT